uniref:Uncharacterized protein n=1 Tax=viral metagenome TaxID=1070528 RepID=A0A6C0FCR7_9ZZZZ|tara:strand:+ start:1434 stop:1910 length:477 start_codon:yes stop_codon:yes gene_type:complete
MSSLSHKIKNIIKNYWHYLLIILMLCGNIYDWANTTELFTQPEDAKLPAPPDIKPEIVKTQESLIKHHMTELKHIVWARLSSGSFPYDSITNNPMYEQLKYILDEGVKPPEKSETPSETTILNNLSSMVMAILHLLSYTEDYILTFDSLLEGTPPRES